MAYTMQDGLTPIQVDLSHTHIRGHKMKMKCLEMRAHEHANRGNGIRNANDMENDMQACQWDFSTEIWGKTAPK